MKCFLSTLAFVLMSFQGLFAQEYKDLMEDKNVNFYDVVANAESYFSTVDTSKKGSGYKQFKRWVYENEQRYYPSGNRQNVDAYFAENEFKRIKATQAIQRMAGETWENLGPFVVDNISGNYNAGLGRVEDFWANPANQDQIILSSRSGGLWKTVDGGANWEGNLTDALIATGVNTFTVNPANFNDIIVNVRNGKNGTSHGLYRSTDGGENWVETNFNPTNLGVGGLGSDFIINDVKFHPTTANSIFIATNQGIYRSTNNLSSWTRLYVGDSIEQVEFHSTNASVVYFLMRFENDKIYRSTNSGVSYTALTVTGNTSSGELSLSADCANCVYIGSSSGVYKSTNQGTSWVKVGDAPAGMYGGYSVSDTDENYMIFGSLDNFRSTDGGANFSISNAWSLGSHGGGTNQENFNSSTSYIHADNRKTRSINGVFYVASDGFLSRSSDFGVTWEILSQGICIRENYKLGASQSNADRFICGSQDNGTTIKTENGFIEMYGADGMEGIVHPLNADWMIGSVQNGTRIRTKNAGANNDGVTPSNEAGVWEAPILVDPFNQMRVLHMSDEVHVSEDFGSNWALKGDPNMSFKITQAEYSYSQEDLLLVSSYEELKKSIDGGETFTNIGGALPFSTISDIAIHPENSDVFIVTYTSYEDNNQKIYQTINGGNTWTNITHNLGNMPIHTAVIDWDSNSRIYVGAEIGVYTKLMSENSWTLYNGNLPNVSVEELEITRGSNKLTAATWGRGLWEIPLMDKENKPSIITTEITDMPTENIPIEGSLQFVTSTIEFTGNPQSVEVLWSLNDTSFVNSIPMENTQGAVWVSETAIPGQTEGNTIYFKIRAIDTDANTTETYRFMYDYKEYAVCAGFGVTYLDTPEFISSTTIGTTVTNSGQDNYILYDQNPIELAVGREYPIEIQLGFFFNGDQAVAYIDYNRNGTFEDEEEITMSAYSDTWLSTGLLSVPYDAVRNEPLILRLRNNYNSDNPCGTFDGEVEDYVVVLKEPCFDRLSTSWNGTNWTNGLPSEILNVEFMSSYNTNGTSVDACSCAIDNNASVTVNSGDYFKTTGTIEVANGSSLFVEHEASVVQVDDKASVINNGNIDVHLITPELKPRDINFLGSPMNNETIDGVFATANRVLQHKTENFIPHPDVTEQFPLAENFVDDNLNDFVFFDGTIVPAEGYLIRSRPVTAVGNEAYDIHYTNGTLNNGLITYPLGYNGSKTASFNVISNPYPSAIDATAFINDNDFIDEVYFWEHVQTPSNEFPGATSANFSMEDVSMFNAIGGTAATSDPSTTPNGYISTGQGFSVKANGLGDAIFKNSQRVTDNNNTLRNQIATTNRLWLELSNETYDMHSSTLIGFTENATPGFDAGYDSNRIATVLSLYSHLEGLSGQKELGIQSRESFNSTQEILLGFSTLVDEEQLYTISIKNLEGLALEYSAIYLEDLVTGVTTNLKEASYQFNAEKGTQSERFLLKFEQEEILNTNSVLQRSVTVSPNPTNGAILITSGNSPMKAITISDIQGRLINTITLSGALQYQMSLDNYKSAVYFITIETLDGTLTKKVIKN